MRRSKSGFCDACGGILRDAPASTSVDPGKTVYYCECKMNKTCDICGKIRPRDEICRIGLCDGAGHRKGQPISYCINSKECLDKANSLLDERRGVSEILNRG